MPNKDVRVNPPEAKLPPTVQSVQNPKVTAATKPGLSKVAAKEPTMSPVGAGGAGGGGGANGAAEEERTELLGSLTTQQQQRTSARVIKKLMLEPAADKRDAVGDKIECETPTKIDDPLKFPTVKQRMPKALWSAEEKSYFFEALNEYGKDFDAITASICAKMKKKGMPDSNLKTKTQVSHFYYRTWHKLSKHVRFDENVKKVAQELYALINYGELRRKLASVNEKTCARLGEMVRCGSMAVRARGRTLRVRTPMCRALRRLNQIAERECGTRVCGRALVVLRARDAAAWARVQAAAHNPRAATLLPLRTELAALLRALQKRWRNCTRKAVAAENGIPGDDPPRPDYYRPAAPRTDDLAQHLHLPTDSLILREEALPRSAVLHVGPRAGAAIHLPALSPGETLSSQKICFSSYLERMGRRDKHAADVKLRNAKRPRKDSVTDKDETKKLKLEDADSTKMMHIDETAIDGIEMMAYFKNSHDDDEKPSTEEDLKAEETAEEEVGDAPDRDKDMSEREKDSFSEMEDDDKFPKSDTDNESDSKTDKNGKGIKFKNLKVKFRLRPLKTGRSIYTMVLDKDAVNGKVDDIKHDELKRDEVKAEELKGDDARGEELKGDEARGEELKGEETKGEELKEEESKEVLKGDEAKEEEARGEVDVETAMRQVRRGWSVYDAGDLTIGDLYLMFGARSKIELDYWWAEPTPPLPQPPAKQKQPDIDKVDKLIDKREKGNKTPEKGDSSVEDEREKRESDTDILFSPKNTFSQDSNDGMSGDERKIEQMASPDHKSGSVKLANKLINRPGPAPPPNQAAPPQPNGFSLLNDRLKRLLALAGNPHIAQPTSAACACGHVCPRRQQPQKQQPIITPIQNCKTKIKPENNSAIFRHPTPIAPKVQSETSEPALSLSDLPRRRRGRAGGARNRRVVVQRLLPLLPKLPPPSNLIPVKIVPNSPPSLPRLLPKPPPTPTSDMSFYYVLSESNGQFYFHDGDRRIPISPLDHGDHDLADSDNDKEECRSDEEEDTKDDIELKVEVTETGVAEPPDPAPATDPALGAESAESAPAPHQPDIANFLPAESMSLSPSRLLRDAEGWLEGSVQDFSLSSFLSHLEGRPHTDIQGESQLQPLMGETSMDYVAKFADLAATADKPLADDLP
ncbi:protein cramped [Aricia agestis]|uniref:protein cramped n=1 Tax=Aricia agestis TaxID=91739 RepID=UPI001C20951F|nr:protein cramped [Aricia agestis]